MSLQSDGYEIVEPSYARALSIWWLFTWRSLAGAFALSLVFGILVAVVTFPFREAGAGSATLLVSLGGAVIGIAWGIYVIRMALNKSYRGFRIVLVKDDTL